MHKYLAKRFNKLTEKVRMRLPGGITTLVPNRESTEGQKKDYRSEDYDMLNMFRALLCPSSGALDYMCVIAAYGVQCLVAGCRKSGLGQQGVRPERGMLHEKGHAT
jgi:hypothetical protein